jgi:hypothetical protein
MRLLEDMIDSRAQGKSETKKRKDKTEREGNKGKDKKKEKSWSLFKAILTTYLSQILLFLVLRQIVGHKLLECVIRDIKKFTISFPI